MNIKTNNMNIELTHSEISQIKELIFSEIDKIGGFDQLSEELQSVCWKFSDKT
jgi:hypothetical protein